MARKKAKPPKPITSIKHKDKRTNTPTEELRDSVWLGTSTRRRPSSTPATTRSTRNWCGGARTSRRLRLRQIAARWVARVALIKKAQRQICLATEFNAARPPTWKRECHCLLGT